VCCAGVVSLPRLRDENDTTELEYLSELLNFSEFLQSTKEQKQLAEFIPKDIVLLKETNHFT
jgi:hypothetical protein